MAERILMNEYKTITKEKWVNIELNGENIFDWIVALIVLNPDSLYYGGYFKARMTFPKNYPYAPPTFVFIRPLYHPNIYPDGRLCISILHNPGEDEMSGELASERWSPVQRVESVLISVLSLLDDPEISSPANVDASVLFRTNKTSKFRDRVKEDVDLSKKDIPEGFVMPTHESTMGRRVVSQESKEDDVEFWAMSEDEEGEENDDDIAGGSDSDAEMTMDDEDGEVESGTEDEDEELGGDDDEEKEVRRKRAKGHD